MEDFEVGGGSAPRYCLSLPRPGAEGEEAGTGVDVARGTSSSLGPTRVVGLRAGCPQAVLGAVDRSGRGGEAEDSLDSGEIRQTAAPG